MRGLICLCLGAAVSACGMPASLEADETSMEAPPSTQPPRPLSLEVSGEGIAAVASGRNAFSFGTERGAVETAVALVLGDPAERDSNDECGAGPMEFSAYVGGLTLNFQDGKLVGWFLRRDEDDAAIATPEGIIVGSSALRLGEVYKVDMVEESTLGAEFTTDEGVSGFFAEEGDTEQVESLYAGTNCFFR